MGIYIHMPLPNFELYLKCIVFDIALLDKLECKWLFMNYFDTLSAPKLTQLILSIILCYFWFIYKLNDVINRMCV